MSVNHDVGLSCIQRRASNCNIGRPSRRKKLHGEDRGLYATVGEQACWDVPLRAVHARRAETYRLFHLC